ncbi:MAG: 1-acyl-sn-glycerol-3-phosphate acyltransferase [Bacteroidales bacterium]|nr:1-acyl-sn-glycerol-3-phosphate acyltransferase [Bacteroidales bacterium]
MKAFFVAIYQYFTNHKAIFAVTLVTTVALLGALASNIRFDENITGFFPNTNEETNFVMNNMQTMNRVVVGISQGDEDVDIYHLMDAAEAYADTLKACPDSLNVELYYDDSTTEELLSLIFNHLPSFLTDDELANLVNLTTDSAIAARLAIAKQLLSNPMVSGVTDYLANDPLGISVDALNRLRTIGASEQFSMIDGYIFDRSQRYLLMFIDLGSDFGETGNNSAIINYIRTTAQSIGEREGVDFYVFGAPVVAVANADQVKFDESWTVTLASVIICVAFLLIFRRKRTVVLIIVSIAFGALFAFGIIAALGIELSLIAVGSGATILGIAMSYAIHMVTHSLHARSVRDLIADMAYPMTVGSITTVGAFLGLMFTSSRILHDLGLFAFLALIGTILFSLIFLPHFLTTDYEHKPSRLRNAVNAISSYDYSRNKLLVIALSICTIIGLFFFNDVRYSNDMSQLNYQGDSWLQQSGDTLQRLLDVDQCESTIAVVGSSVDEVAKRAADFTALCYTYADSGLNAVSSIAPTLLTDSLKQTSRIARWSQFWTAERRAQVKFSIERHAKDLGFADGCFDNFFHIIDNDFVAYLPDNQEIAQSPILKNWITTCDDKYILNINVSLSPDHRDNLLATFDSEPNVVVTDLGYFVRCATDGIANDFNFILLISSTLVALVLLISYGRIELFLLSFLPMCISWVIILGFMTICGIEFNVVSIILATFIFGVGDDFSIFIVDGLQSNYATGRRMLESHKAAILLSGFAIIVGLGVQIFASHPAVHSLGLLSILGLAAVILTSYVVQPLLFRIFISKPAKHDNPVTLFPAFRTIFCFGLFGICCLVANIFTNIIKLIPLGKNIRRALSINIIRAGMRVTNVAIGLFIKRKFVGTFDTSRPQIAIANHQSFIDVITLISLIPKCVIVAKTWVTNSPLYGRLVQTAGFYNINDGHTEMITKLRPLVEQGYSIVVFPEGSRSSDLEIHRFHKGAFLLAQSFNLPITPIVIFGNGMIAHKEHFLTRKGLIVNKILSSFTIGDSALNDDLRHVTKQTCELMRAEYDALRKEYDTAINPYYTERLVVNYTYKLPYLEQKILRNLKRERNFSFIDTNIDAAKPVTIIDSSYGELTTLLAMRHKQLNINTYLCSDERCEIAANGHIVRQENASTNRLNFSVFSDNLIEVNTPTLIINTNERLDFNLDGVTQIFMHIDNVQIINTEMFTPSKSADGWALYIRR